MEYASKEEITSMMVEDCSSPHYQQSPSQIIEKVLGGLKPKEVELAVVPIKIEE